MDQCLTFLFYSHSGYVLFFTTHVYLGSLIWYFFMYTAWCYNYPIFSYYPIFENIYALHRTGRLHIHKIPVNSCHTSTTELLIYKWIKPCCGIKVSKKQNIIGKCILQTFSCYPLVSFLHLSPFSLFFPLICCSLFMYLFISSSFPFPMPSFLYGIGIVHSR